MLVEKHIVVYDDMGHFMWHPFDKETAQLLQKVFDQDIEFVFFDPPDSHLGPMPLTALRDGVATKRQHTVYRGSDVLRFHIVYNLSYVSDVKHRVEV